jgi:hypothetical protein
MIWLSASRMLKEGKESPFLEAAQVKVPLIMSPMNDWERGWGGGRQRPQTKNGKNWVRETRQGSLVSLQGHSPQMKSCVAAMQKLCSDRAREAGEVKATTAQERQVRDTPPSSCVSLIKTAGWD